MSRSFTPKVITANRLREGDVVYLTADDRWSPFHHEAELIEDEAHGQLRLLHAAAQKLLVVGAYPQGSAPPDQLHGAPDESERARHAIAATADPARDPVSGTQYPTG